MILEGKIDEILELIIEGQTFRQIAAKYDVAIGTLHNYLSSDEHSARARAALELSASQYADKAEEVLINAPESPIEIARARELAQHYRWKASKRNPTVFGDKMNHNHAGAVANLNIDVSAEEAKQIAKALNDSV